MHLLHCCPHMLAFFNIDPHYFQHFQSKLFSTVGSKNFHASILLNSKRADRLQKSLFLWHTYKRRSHFFVFAITAHGCAGAVEKILRSRSPLMRSLLRQQILKIRKKIQIFQNQCKSVFSEIFVEYHFLLAICHFKKLLM